ncbi:fructofuranosidase/invertase [Pedobacter riviphilus]|uniref:beta-fructofuranosidase n=1 Tax=Pedobacter riviphilus TaxID=2766984 RepID=A0ABX6TNH0_9SPHI|nr:glycoside hydrolase 100 family protein [Pedobacter riviphilus]QNR85925.1 fructofuranosidase/invertase [Pedobacter riviphilus]
MVDQIAYHRAINLLHQASTPFGFVAAVQEHDNYKRVWTRDGVITAVAAMLTGEKKLIETAELTIKTLFSNQHTNGFMPSNVSPADGSVSFGGTTGRADNPAWAVIGICAYTICTGEKALYEQYQNEIDKCFQVMEAWEFNGKHLMYVPQSGDWADEYIQHGYILFDQLLRVWALKLASSISGNKKWTDKSAHIIKTIRQNYWKHNDQQISYTVNLNHQMKDGPDHFWLMGFNPSRIYTYFDLQANVFALLLNLGDTKQNESVIHYFKALYQQKNLLLPSFYPAIRDTDADMNELKNNYAYSFRNHPDYFHNGGLWPVWNGCLAAALAKHGETEFAKAITLNIHAANAKDSLFNECLHGVSQKPCGVPNCTWSAAGAIIAEQAATSELFKTLFAD